jgi:RNA polymerase sigma factor (sigma-70 family)
LESDVKIWDDFRRGEKHALSYVYYKYVELLYRYGRKFSSDHDLIKDTLQDLFFDLIRTRQNLGPTDNIRFYLMRSFRRKLTVNMKKTSPDDNREFTDLQPDIVYSIEEELIERESLSRREILINQCLQDLHPRQREILYYRYTCNLSYEEICGLMSIKYDSARKLVFRALESLRNLVGDNSFIQLLVMNFSSRK